MGWDCVCGVCSSLESLIDFFNERFFEDSFDEETEEYNTELSNMSLDELKKYIRQKHTGYVIHEKYMQ
jgi:hypothetical protein